LPANVLLQGSRLPRLRKEIGRLKVFATIRWVVGHVRRNMHANHLVGANSIPQDAPTLSKHLTRARVDGFSRKPNLAAIRVSVVWLNSRPSFLATSEPHRNECVSLAWKSCASLCRVMQIRATDAPVSLWNIKPQATQLATENPRVGGSIDSRLRRSPFGQLRCPDSVDSSLRSSPLRGAFGVQIGLPY